jgi:hypothetical protein
MDGMKRVESSSALYLVYRVDLMVLGQVSVCGIYGFFTYNFFSMAKRQWPLTGKMVFCPLFGTDNVESHIWLD